MHDFKRRKIACIKFNASRSSAIRSSAGSLAALRTADCVIFSAGKLLALNLTQAAVPQPQLRTSAESSADVRSAACIILTQRFCAAYCFSQPQSTFFRSRRDRTEFYFNARKRSAGIHPHRYHQKPSSLSSIFVMFQYKLKLYIRKQITLHLQRIKVT